MENRHLISVDPIRNPRYQPAHDLFPLLQRLPPGYSVRPLDCTPARPEKSLALLRNPPSISTPGFPLFFRTTNRARLIPRSGTPNRVISEACIALANAMFSGSRTLPRQ